GSPGDGSCRESDSKIGRGPSYFATTLACIRSAAPRRRCSTTESGGAGLQKIRGPRVSKERHRERLLWSGIRHELCCDSSRLGYLGHDTHRTLFAASPGSACRLPFCRGAPPRLRLSSRGVDRRKPAIELVRPGPMAYVPHD